MAHADWQGRRVLVTGGAGFLGSHLVPLLAGKGAEVTAARSARHDLRRAEAALDLVEGSRPDLVIHLAGAVGGIGANAARPATFLHTNLLVGANILEAVRIAGVPEFIGVASVCAYPAAADLPLRETSLWDGYPEATNAAYGIAKRTLIAACQAYRDQHGIRAVAPVVTNLYGPGDSLDVRDAHVIPALILKFLKARRDGADAVTCWGDGSPTRDFLHVADAARGLVLVAEGYDDREPINLGTGREISIREVAEIIAEVTGFQGRITWDRSRPSGQRRRAVDTTRATEILGFRPEKDLREGIRETVDWYISRTEA